MKQFDVKAAPAIGDLMPDGTKYAGISPDTGKAMYVTPADARLTYMFNETGNYVKGLNKRKAFGHSDWRVPSKAELDVLFNNRAAMGGFVHISDPSTAGRYWSCTPYGSSYAWAQRFSDGTQGGSYRTNDSSLRCVR